MRTTIAAAIRENRMQPAPRILRLPFSVLMPNMKSTTVIAASTSDIAIIENQYRILNTDGAMELSLFKSLTSLGVRLFYMFVLFVFSACK
ncbi:hypothetical protein D3C81_1858940 [compost metagenome]